MPLRVCSINQVNTSQLDVSSRTLESMPASYCPAVQSRVKLPAVKHDLMVPHCFHTSSNLCSKCRMQATASVQFSPQQFTRGDWHALQGARKIDFAAFERHAAAAGQGEGRTSRGGTPRDRAQRGAQPQHLRHPGLCAPCTMTNPPSQVTHPLL